MELLLGAGQSRQKKLVVENKHQWDDLITLDMNPDHKPDVVHDLDVLPYPFADNTFAEIHAYDVMEHCGKLGDWRFFFAQWTELWRISKPGGVFLGISPHVSSPWAWGDPGHTRIITAESLHFLDQSKYWQVGATAMSDYRPYYHADWTILHTQVDDGKRLQWALRAVKPARNQEP